MQRSTLLGCLAVLCPLGAWLILRPSPAGSVYLASAREMESLAPGFVLSLAHVPEDRVDQAMVDRALKDAEKCGEKCAFYFAAACPASRRILYVLNLQTVADTQLIYAGSLDGDELVAKAYWNGFGGWINPAAAPGAHSAGNAKPAPGG